MSRGAPVYSDLPLSAADHARMTRRQLAERARYIDQLSSDIYADATSASGTDRRAISLALDLRDELLEIQKRQGGAKG